MNTEMPGTYWLAAEWWFEFGLKVVPIDSGEKKPAVKWKPWLDDLSRDSIARHWRKYPQHELGAIVDNQLLILDADSPEAIGALYATEEAFDLTPNLVVTTRKGEHHYFKRALGTYAHMDSFNTENEPEKIDIRTGRQSDSGRSIIILPPSTNKTIKINEADYISDLVEVNQDFIDAVFRHNGREAPRVAPERKQVSNSFCPSILKISEILSYINPGLGYDDWLKVLMGLHDEFNGSDVGLDLADQWSSHGSNYMGFEEIEYKWRAFIANKKNGITFATVARMASDAGANLKEIASRYDNDGNRLKSFDALLAVANSMSSNTDSDSIEALVTETLRLPPVQREKVFAVTKAKTKLSMATLKDIVKEHAKERNELDHLELVLSVINKIGDGNIINSQSFTWSWRDSGVWRRLEERALRQLVQKHIKEVQAIKITKTLVDGVTDLLKTEIYQPDHQFDVGKPETVNCLNGELLLGVDGQCFLLPHCRENYRTTQIPVSYNPNATAPHFMQYMREVFKGDDDADDKIKAILEMFGYTLMGHCRHERFVILVGNGANGKSVLLAVLEALCGFENVAGVQPSHFDRSFQRAHLHGKLANIVTEVKQGEVIDDASLKGIVSGEPTTVEHKFKDPFVMRPFSTCWFGTNHMPHTRDFSDALFRRALIIQFNQVFKAEFGNCNPMLKEKLFTELPGILNIAIKAYASALSSSFTVPASCLDAREDWRLDVDQVAQFVQEECVRNSAGQVKVMDLYCSYTGWANISGIHAKVTIKSFRDRLTKLGFGSSRDAHARYVTGLIYRGGLLT